MSRTDEDSRRRRGRDGGGDAGAGDAPSGIGRLVPAPVRRRYAAKFFVAVLGVILLVGLVGGVTFLQIQDTIERDAKAQLRTTAALQAESVEEWVGGRTAEARLLSANDVYARTTPARVDRFLERALADRVTAGVVALHYVNRSGGTGRVTASTVDTLEGARLGAADPPWDGVVARVPRDPARTDDVVVGAEAYRRGNRTVMPFASGTDSAGGVLVVVADVSEGFHRAGTRPSGASTTILNATGHPVFGPGQRAGAGEVTGERLRDGAEGVVVREGDRQVRAYAPLERTGWVAVTSAPRAELYQASLTVGSNVVLLVGVVLVTLSVVAAAFGRHTVVPVVRLRERAAQMRRGNLDVDLSTDRADEIGRLYGTVDEMRAALREQIAEAEAARREAERSKRELERQNERLDQFASTLSHDLRNPLTVARGHVDLLSAKVESGTTDPEDLEAHVSAIESAHARMDDIIDDVLTLTRRGETVEETESVSLAAVARDAWRHVDAPAATLTVTGSRDVEADPDRLQRAFENLFRNAVEHAATGDGVGVTVGLTDDGFYVADDGPGIPEDEADAVFEYGYSTSDGGTGLGLSIVRTIAQAHGWTVDIDRERAAGACFVFGDVFDDVADPDGDASPEQSTD